MAVTSGGKVFKLTAAADELAYPVVVKTIRWVGADAEEDALQLTESSIGDTTKVIYDSEAGGNANVEETLKELYFPFGIRVGTLDSGTVAIYVK